MEQIKLIISIVERGKGVAMQKLYGDYQIFLHNQRVGRGTATSEIMDILGLDSSEKDIVLSYAPASVSDQLMSDLDNDLRGAVRTSGIVFDIPLTGVNNLVAMAISYQTEQTRKGNGGVSPVEGAKKSSMILITCSRGCADEIMITAKAKGARGGTVMKARTVGVEDLEQAYDLKINNEREIVAIVVTAEKRNAIMDAVNEAHGLKSDAQAMICSLPIDQIVHL